VNAGPPTDHGQRPGAYHRRDAVLVAARGEFAEWGYHGATTAAIARRADISQSYIYALFASKKDLFIECQRWNHRQIMDIMDAAADTTDPTEARARMHQMYVDKVEHRHHFLFRLQATAAAASDSDVAHEVRQSFIEGFEKLLEVIGPDPEEVKAYILVGVFADMAAAMRLPQQYWPDPPTG
jgi:AcrR family transcriptional regulator